MMFPTLPMGQAQKLGVFSVDDSDFALEDTLQCCHLEDDDGTTIHTSSDSDESEDDGATIYTSSDSNKPEDDAEVYYGVRVRNHPERLPELWCEEAERETPELEQPPQVGANTSTKAHEAIINAGACCHAQSAAQQQDPEVPGVVCGIEFSRDPKTLEFWYRRKVLERKEVKQDALRELIKEIRVQAVFYNGNQVPHKHVRYMYEGSIQLAGDLEVLVTSLVWSDWMKCLECYKVDKASFEIYQKLLTTGVDDRID